MTIDARKFKDPREVFLKLKEAFGSPQCSKSVSVEVLVNSLAVAKRVKAFAAMSGCQTTINGVDGSYSLHITGGYCGCR